MSYWIEQLGFWGYMKRFPVNPITIVGGVVVIGIVVLVVNAALRKKKAECYRMEHAGAVVMTFHKMKVGNQDFADNIRLVTLNGQPVSWFFLRPAVPAVYLRPGENRIELYAEWARQGGGVIKNYKSQPEVLTVSVEAEKMYSLEYDIPGARFVVGVGECDEPR